MDELRDIPGFEGLYSITPDGRLFSNRFNRWLQVKPDEQGYFRTILSVNNIQYGVLIHHLVLITYVGPRPPGLLGLHKDDIKSNNHFSNLMWGTQQQNSDQAKSNNRLRPSTSSRRFSPEEVRDIRKRARSGESMAQIAALLNTGGTVIRNIISGKSYKEVE